MIEAMHYGLYLALHDMYMNIIIDLILSMLCLCNPYGCTGT